MCFPCKRYPLPTLSSLATPWGGGIRLGGRYQPSSAVDLGVHHHVQGARVHDGLNSHVRGDGKCDFEKGRCSLRQRRLRGTPMMLTNLRHRQQASTTNSLAPRFILPGLRMEKDRHGGEPRG